MEDQRPVEPALDVVLAGPYQVNRRATLDGLGHLSELDRPIPDRVAPATKAPATQQRIDLDLLRLEAQHLRDHRLIDGLELATRPDLRPVAAHLDDAIQRLHRRVSQVRGIFGSVGHLVTTRTGSPSGSAWSAARSARRSPCPNEENWSYADFRLPRCLRHRYSKKSIHE
jgi:hypothetical protein